MRYYSLTAFSLMVLLASGAFAQPLELPAMHHLDDGEKLQTALLPPTEIERILAQVRETSFDWPDSWDSELRARRVSLGDQEGLVVQGTKLLCGGTGNCQTWIFGRLHGRWADLFEKEAPVIAGFGFLPKTSNGIRELVTVANAGGGRNIYIVFVFDGSLYRERRCYQQSADGKGNPRSMKSVPCMQSSDPAKR